MTPTWKIEVGVLATDGETLWPIHYRTWATDENFGKGLKHVIDLTEGETIGGFRFTKVQEEDPAYD